MSHMRPNTAKSRPKLGKKPKLAFYQATTINYYPLFFEKIGAEGNKEGENMKVKAKDVIGSKIVIKDLNVGKVKEIVIDTDTGRVTHLEIELTKDAAEQAIGIKKGGIKNYLSVSAISGGQSDFRSGIIELKISTKQLRIYLSPTSE